MMGGTQDNRTWQAIFLLVAFSCSFGSSFLLELTASNLDKNHLFKTVSHVAKAPSCQVEDVEALITQLLSDLPSYANRISQRNRRRQRVVDSYSYMIVAGRPEFAPLTLGPGEYLPQEQPASDSQQPQQVFMTTLERQYIEGKPVELQQFHWLFFTRSNNVWRLAIMFSRTGTYPAQQPPTRPRDSSNGVVAQAIRLWLRDCDQRRVS